MQAVQVRATGGSEALELCELPDPIPNKDEVLVRVRRSSVNFIDVYHREGKYKAPLPFIPGRKERGMWKPSVKAYLNSPLVIQLCGLVS
jgi:NADPH:quinone reductase